ncbi:MAG TPA: hypothetical protein VFB13_11830 [Reyranella sp.]|jgi:hypothetical protein|nr:hypothetical protein [Reyranella sp.]
MRRSICVAAIAAAMALAGGFAQAESPIPTNRVPGFGGPDYNSTYNNTPSAVGSDVGTNVGAGANASPGNDIVTPANRPNWNGVTSLPGTSGGITITR